MEIILILAGLGTIYGMICMWVIEWYERPRYTKAPGVTTEEIREMFSEIAREDGIITFDAEGGFTCTRLSNPKN